MPTREELYDLVSDLATELAPPPPPPPPALNTGTGLYLIPGDAYIAPGERSVRVPVSLSIPPNQTMIVRWGTANGTRYSGASGWFMMQGGFLDFNPGEQHKTITVTTTKDLGVTGNFNIAYSIVTSGMTIPDWNSLIHSDPVGVNTKIVPKATSLPTRPTGLVKIFEENFGPDWTATDTGFLADGVTPCWRTRHGHGRTQPGNKEIGYYSDPVINPGTNSWIRDPVTGKVQLQLEYFPDGVKDINGNNIPYDFVPVPAPGYFQFSSTVLTTQRMALDVLPGCYVEGRMSMPVKLGTWPAFWLLPKAFQTWPSIEVDFFEGFWNALTLDKIGSTSHWKNATGGHSMFGEDLRHIGITDYTQPLTWGWYWGEKEVTFYINDIPYSSHPNVFPTMPCFLLLDITTAPQVVGPIPDPANTLPAKMTMDWVRVWK